MPSSIGYIFRLFEVDLYIAHRGKVIDFIRLNVFGNTDQADAVGHVAIMQEKLRIFLMTVHVKMVIRWGVELPGTAFAAVHNIAFIQ